MLCVCRLWLTDGEATGEEARYIGGKGFEMEALMAKRLVIYSYMEGEGGQPDPCDGSNQQGLGITD